MSLTRNFKVSDFQCHCIRCADKAASPVTKIETVEKLQVARDSYGLPIFVSRGVSCPEHNADIGGAEDSRHLPTHCDAIDVKIVDAANAFELLPHLISAGFTAFRVYHDHIHVDDRPGARLFLASPE